MSWVGDWVWRIAVRKMVTRVVLGAVALYGAQLAQYGITVDPTALVLGLLALLEALRDYLQVRFKWTWLS